MRRARDSLEWTLETLAAATDISRSTLSRIETGARRADVGEVASILTALAVTGPAKQRLLRLAGEGAGTWVEIGSAMDQQLSAIAAYESEARSISDFQISVIPGLLQTSDYARNRTTSSPATQRGTNMIFEFRKSSYSGGGSGTCVEVALNVPGTRAIRDSKNPAESPLFFDRRTFTAFLTAIKSDRYPAA